MSENKNGVNWDLTSYFPEFNGQVMIEFKIQLKKDILQLQEKGEKAGSLSNETLIIWSEIIKLYENFGARIGHLSSYLGCLSAADAGNEQYSREQAELNSLLSERDKFEVYLLEALKEADDDVFSSFLKDINLQNTEHFLIRLREKAQKRMTREKEILASELNVNGFHTWGRLYDTITGKLKFTMNWPDGKSEIKPISEWRSLMSDADFETGKAAFLGGNEAWKSIEDTCAAALNSIAGTRFTLYKHRGFEHFLEMALFQANIKRETLDAMYEAIHRHLDVARDIFKAKASFNGRDGIWWFEREAPLNLKDTGNFTWEQGRDIVAESFKTVYPNLADYYIYFLNKRWIESESRGGKRPGAFCTSSSVTNEQKVFMTFNGALGDVTTLAHEVGHAFHGHILTKLRPIARMYPMTLAETASIFAEHILAEGIYTNDEIGDSQKLLMLDADLCGAAVLLLDITIRYEFEKAFHEERLNGEVGVSRLKELMVEKQKLIFGDAMASGGEDEMFWASKLHFYITTVTFYNFPYTFGFLMARALYNIFQKEGKPFLARYEDFLRLTGSDTVENVAMKSIGADISKPEFWEQAITSLNEPLLKYKQLLKTSI